MTSKQPKPKERRSLVKAVKNHPLIAAIGLISLVLSFPLTVQRGYESISDIYSNSIGYKNKQYGVIGKLKPDANIRNYTEELGEAWLSRTDKNTGYRESIYIDDFYYCQIVTDGDGTIKFYTVTSRKKDFKPSLKSPQGTIVTLGETRFSSLEWPPADWFGGAFTRRALYKEIQTYLPRYGTGLFAWNDAGYQWEAGDFWDLDTASAPATDEKLRAFRKESIINTFGITSPDLSIESLDDIIDKTGFPVGVESEEMQSATGEP